MEIFYLLKGMLMGLLIAVPVGPIGILCVRRSLTEGRHSGLFSGLGAATADALYGSIAGFGLTFVSAFLISHELWLRLAGGLFLVLLGIRTLLTQPPAKSCQENRIATGQKKSSMLRMYVSTFFLTLANPITILSFASIFAAMGMAGAKRGYVPIIIMIMGVFIGSSAWWLLLTGVISLFNLKCNTEVLRWVNKISGTLLTLFGLVAVLSMYL
ncbi:lysine-type exporter protein (lyse/ygga) [Lucifera butyrica]|uniref:Lysine-type exporter protein (Lyse/ygga) n=1 Tax=Lucifera butyrica TaxID=1351585 RepID=A0A498RE73_9FIRM|nr:LysE family transporter [Lucifera butyrica]VBB07488.1 lysine-type exporter protein (lyse/ygga) [Lucifera butyrica]